MGTRRKATDETSEDTTRERSAAHKVEDTVNKVTITSEDLFFCPQL